MFTHQKLSNILEYINHYQEEFLPKSDTPSSRGVGEFDFICLREVLVMLMCTPYTMRDGWSIRATKFKKNIYLSRAEIARNQEDVLDQNENQKKAWAFGHKFEQYCMTKNPSEEPNTSIPVDQCEKFVCMYRINIEGMELLFGATVDGAISSTVCKNIQSKEVLNSLKMMELKCTLRPGNRRQHDHFHRFKYKNWWCQSFLVGIEDLMVGFRNDSGFVEEIRHIKVSSLPELSASFWSASQCAEFLVKFLKMVKDLMKNVNCPYTVYEFYFNPQSKNVEYQIYPDKSLHPILPDWYVSMLQQRSSLGLTATVSNK